MYTKGGLVSDIINSSYDKVAAVGDNIAAVTAVGDAIEAGGNLVFEDPTNSAPTYTVAVPQGTKPANLVRYDYLLSQQGINLDAAKAYADAQDLLKINRNGDTGLTGNFRTDSSFAARTLSITDSTNFSAGVDFIWTGSDAYWAVKDVLGVSLNQAGFRTTGEMYTNAPPLLAQDIANKSYVDTQDALKVSLTGTEVLTNKTLVNPKIDSELITSSDDLDNFITDGFYKFSDTSIPLNAPSGITQNLLTVRKDAGQPVQMVWGGSDNAKILAFRRRDNGAWTSWDYFTTKTYTDTKFLQFPSNETNPVVLPSIATRAGKYLFFDPITGNINVASSTVTATATATTYANTTGKFGSATQVQAALDYLDANYATSSEVTTAVNNEAAARVATDDMQANLAGGNLFTGSQSFNGEPLVNVGAGVADTDAATIGGVETLKNKNLTSPVLTSPSLTFAVLTSPIISSPTLNTAVTGTAVVSTINSSTTKIPTSNAVKLKHETGYASPTVGGSIKMKVIGTTLYITNNGSNP